MPSGRRRLGDRPAGHRLVVAGLVGDDFLAQGPRGGVDRAHLVVAVGRSRQVLDDVEDLPVGRERVVFERPGELDDPGLDARTVRRQDGEARRAACAAGRVLDEDDRLAVVGNADGHRIRAEGREPPRAVDRLVGASNPGWTTRSFTTVLVPSDDAVTSRPQVAFGMPVGRSKIRSPELARRTCRSSSPRVRRRARHRPRRRRLRQSARPRVRRSGGESVAWPGWTSRAPGRCSRPQRRRPAGSRDDGTGWRSVTCRVSSGGGADRLRVLPIHRFPWRGSRSARSGHRLGEPDRRRLVERGLQPVGDRRRASRAGRRRPTAAGRGRRRSDPRRTGNAGRRSASTRGRHRQAPT